MRRNPAPTDRGTPLPLQRQALGQAQKKSRTRIVRGRGQAYNLTTEEAEASEEVMAGKILVHNNSGLALFDAGESHCFISSKFVALYCIPLVCVDGRWEICTGNEIVTTNRICKACPIELCDRKLEANMLMLDNGGYDVVLGMTRLSKHHAMAGRTRK